VRKLLATLIVPAVFILAAQLAYELWADADKAKRKLGLAVYLAALVQGERAMRVSEGQIDGVGRPVAADRHVRALSCFKNSAPPIARPVCDRRVIPEHPQAKRSIIMRIRFISWLALAVAAAFLVVASTAFALADIVALALGIGIGMLVVSLGIAYGYRTHIATLITALVTAVVSAWMIVASQVFSQAAVQNLTLAASLAIGGLAIVGLVVHELSTERVVHSLEVGAGRRESEPAAA